jgi:hypothetical protein
VQIVGPDSNSVDDTSTPGEDEPDPGTEELNQR